MSPADDEVRIIRAHLQREIAKQADECVPLHRAPDNPDKGVEYRSHG
ncbi:hypothetical protein PC116_g2446 [Phytophthora cactorum]|uniref:Uncharacterized protein n=1 Tax=Phytophthora cactorum TaxID=29920 RepID=A0A8T1LJX5_9STRA|nr:hypothetical protein PC111_g1871 [Phytophthora cactorum]KAG2941896.1 hypothetical protein PC115_g1679 [Phytophthora cactorum]KAG2952781.1 hypothetical protein PC117_g2514 [Phytophthora cactorum]KAG3033129.1 hypothetical protein PC120_g2105 [Phytophthora cactorum]KAG3038964.1 hypothetical protein PC119_g2514 [Phytophthora cactorum]